MRLVATISGSYSKALKEIEAKAKELRKLGITILSPQNPEYSSTQNGFVYLKKDKGTPLELETKHLDAISKSHFLYVVNPKGYLGRSALIEIGFALAQSIPVYSSHPFGDVVWGMRIKNGKGLAEIKQEILAKFGAKEIPGQKSQQTRK